MLSDEITWPSKSRNPVRETYDSVKDKAIVRSENNRQEVQCKTDFMIDSNPSLCDLKTYFFKSHGTTLIFRQYEAFPLQ